MSVENEWNAASQEIHETTHVYKPLELNQIRLLELWPLRGIPLEDRDMPGEIITLSLNEAAAQGYQALSYTWGALGSTKKLKIRGSGSEGLYAYLHVTEQLHYALLHLRPRDMSRRIWIDQVCINQDDNEERSAQVQMMRDIYQKAESTIVWLGAPTQADDLPIIAGLIAILRSNTLPRGKIEAGVSTVKEKNPFMTDIPELHRRKVQQDHDQSIMWEHVRASGDPECTPLQARRYNAIVRLFNQPWFARAWVVQEVLVSRSLVVFYGPLNISFDVLERLGAAVQGAICDTIGWLHALHNKTHGYQAFETLTQANQVFKHSGCPGKNFLAFLFGLQESFGSTDTRDKIYCVLGLKHKLDAPTVLPDYSKSTVEVFTNVAVSFIQESSTLDVIGLVEGNEKWLCQCQNEIPGLPSWVPNWTQKFHGIRPFYFVEFPNRFRSARGHKHEYIDLKMPGRLLVRGKQVASIRQLFPVSFDGGNSYFDGLKNYIQLDEIMQYVSEDNFNGDIKSALLRTLLADGGFEHEQPLTFSIDKILNIIDQEDLLKASRIVDANESLKQVRAWSLVLQRKRCFMADCVGGPTFGLGFFYTLPGDVVCVLYGSSVPFVLRPVQSNSGEKLYKAVGQCYLDGWMYGDYPLQKWWEEFEKAPDEFILV